MDAIYCGIDVGTQGARCVLCTGGGEIVGREEASYRGDGRDRLPEGWFEQSPRDWLRAVRTAVRGAVEQMQGGKAEGQIVSVGVTSTSGTLCALDAAGDPVRPAIMYSDNRSAAESGEVNEKGAELAGKLGYRFKPSFALPKILWVLRHEPERFERTAVFCSATDVVIGWLTGEFERTDQSNALKFGYDLVDGEWPSFISHDLGIPSEKLPVVQNTGDSVGCVSAEVGDELGLPAEVPVAAGLTDGCAALISSGAVDPGEFNTTIGTTLVIKGVSRDLLRDAEGRIYCHKHPDGWWLPGGASNSGAECIAREFRDRERDRLTRRVLETAPTDLVSYPLVGTGERFPFSTSSAEAFLLGTPANRADLFVGYLEGIACLERMAYEVLDDLGAEVGEIIFSSGGGARNDGWLQIRADMLGRAVHRPRTTGAAMGAAVVGACVTGRGLSQAAGSMVTIDRRVFPRPAFREVYSEKYGKFVTECQRRGYL